MKIRFGGAAAFAALAILSIVLAMPQHAAAQNAESEPVKADQALSEQAKLDPAPAKIDLGKAIFAERCSHCHGPNMVNSGTITPDLRRFPDDHDRFVNTVKHGKNNRMPPWGDVLNDDDIAELWAYVSSRRTP
jgi:mono/diheme cytochrome c family protein